MELNFDLKLVGLNNVKQSIDKKLKRVLWLSMNKIENLASEYAPVDTGRLKNSIFLYPVREGETQYIVADGVEYGAWVEFGTSPHIIKPKTKKSLAWKDKGSDRTIFAKRVRHPGTMAHPFFRPALKEVRDFWIRYYTEKVFKG